MNTKIIYIIGTGHSGSTLLDLLLSSSKQVMGLGELKYTKLFIENIDPDNTRPEKEFVDDTMKRPEESAFWKHVVLGLNPDVMYDPTKGFFRRLGLFFSKEYLQTEKNILSRAFKQAKQEKKDLSYIVDSSNDLLRLLLLNRIRGIEVIPVHLMRDGRGVVNSFEKIDRHWLSTYIGWLLNNLIIRFIVRTKVSYDDLARNPDKTLQKLASKLKISIPKKYLKTINSQTSYRFAGNWMRRKKLTAITYDESWKQRMPKWKQWVLTVLCYIPNKLWVYNE